MCDWEFGGQPLCGARIIIMSRGIKGRHVIHVSRECESRVKSWPVSLAFCSHALLRHTRGHLHYTSFCSLERLPGYATVAFLWFAFASVPTMAWGGGSSFSFGSVYRFLSSSIAAELKLDLSRVDQVVTAANGRPDHVCLVQ